MLVHILIWITHKKKLTSLNINLALGVIVIKQIHYKIIHHLCRYIVKSPWSKELHEKRKEKKRKEKRRERECFNECLNNKLLTSMACCVEWASHRQAVKKRSIITTGLKFVGISFLFAMDFFICSWNKIKIPS